VLTRVYSAVIEVEEDAVTVRRQARRIAALLGFESNDQTRISTAVSEIARNAFHYAGGGLAEFLLDTETSLLTIRLADKGPGIRDLKKVLSGTYRSSTGMGIGIIGARRLMDDFAIDSKPGEGTVVTLAKRLPPHAPAPTAQLISKLVSELIKAGPPTAADELRAENRDLLRLLEELRARQEDLGRLNAELEDTNRGVVALYAELDEKAERLRRADEMKSRFLSHMSHEFRTPLTSIMALSRLLVDEGGSLSSEQQKQAMFIRKSAENLLEMVNDLLDFARVEAGKTVVRPAQFQMANLFGALRGVLKPLQVSPDVELVFEEPAGIPPLFTDESKVAQILRNFISNALKFTERGEVRVSARLNEDGSRVVFSVADTGIGIDPAHQDLIFREFAQVDLPIQQRFKGTGLGLPLARGLAELLHGRVRVESTPGQGSTFFAEIPLVYSEPGSEQPEAGCDVLVIDDEEVSRYLVRQCLGSGVTAAEAVDGASGIDAARRLHPRSVLLDLRMPGVNGFQVLERIAADPATRGIPVVVLTSKALTAAERATLESHAAAVLSKDVLSCPDAGDRIRAALKVPYANIAESRQ
jgi:signal transduction histidine kinase/CheY-like chemotaxis protein